MTKSSIHITVVSDVSCPWCYVGRTRLNNAIKSLPDKEITVEYHPYVIDFGTKKTGEEYMAYNVRRWGGDGWTYSMRETSKKDGCTFKNWKYWPYSLHCHRLMAYANGINKGDELMGIFYQMNYEEGKNLSIKEGLMEASERCGLDMKIAERIIDGEENKTLVINEIHEWQQYVDGVPYYIVSFPNGKKKSLEGANSTNTWIKLLTSED